MISSAFVVLSCVDFLWVTFVLIHFRQVQLCLSPWRQETPGKKSKPAEIQGKVKVRDGDDDDDDDFKQMRCLSTVL